VPNLTDAPFAVTGASGYIASWVVHELLSRGATVHATVRDPTAKKKVAYLTQMGERLPGTLKLFAADLLSPGSFANAFADCGVVLHTASPFLVGKIRDPQRQLVDPALSGTRNVLRQVDNTPSVRRVVLTSSVASVCGDNADCAVAGGTLTEEHWNETSSLEHNPYPYSKTVAEREAWKIARAQDRWDLVVINPAFVMGPSLPPDRRDGASVDFMRKTIDGTFRMGTLDIRIGWVDVREVAFAHVEAAIRDDASGRHILSATVKSFYDAGMILEQELGDRVKVPARALPRWVSFVAGPLNGFSLKYIARNVGFPFQMSNERSKARLGVKYRPLEQTLVEHAEQILAQR
jgi:nucleoside-diphosphate-sugar epimerase